MVRARDVDIVLWAVFNVMDEPILKPSARPMPDMGIKGFKVDFIDRDDQTASRNGGTSGSLPQPSHHLDSRPARHLQAYTV